MPPGGLADKGWEKMQIKTFTKWTNMHLAKRGQPCDDLFTAFHDGTKLALLLEILTGETIEKIRPKEQCKMKIHNQENIEKCLKFIESKGVRLLNIGPVNIYDGTVMLILGMVWQLILNLDVVEMSAEELNSKDALLLWCQKKTAGYHKVDVKNFSSSWQSGLAFCALIHKHKPGLLDYDSLDPTDAKGNMKKAFDIAESLGIPRFLDVEDMTSDEKPDEKSVMTYLFQWYRYFSAGNKGENAARRIGKLIAMNRLHDKMKADYELQANAFAAWAKKKTEDLNALRPENNLESVVGQQAELNTFQTHEKPPKALEKAAIESSYHTLQLKLKNAKRPPYVAPAGTSADEVNAAWKGVGAAEKECADFLKAELKRQRLLVDLVARFVRLATKIENYNSAKAEYASAEEHVSSVSQAQNKIAAHKGFLQDLAATKPHLAEAGDLNAKITALNYNDAAGINARYEGLVSALASLDQKGAAKAKALDAALAREKHKNVVRKEFAQKAKGAKAFFQTTGLSIQISGFGNSLESVQEAKAGLDAAAADVQAKADAQLNAVLAKADELKELGVTDNEYTALTTDDVNAANAELRAKLAKQAEAYAAELEHMERLEANRREFAAAAAKLQGYLQSQREATEALEGQGDDERVANIESLWANGDEVAEMLKHVHDLDNDIKSMLKATENRHTPLSASDLDRLVASAFEYKTHHIGLANENKLFAARTAQAEADRTERIRRETLAANYANEANALEKWVGNVEDNVGQSLASLTSVEQVAVQQGLLDRSNGEREDFSARMNALQAQAEEMAAEGITDFGGMEISAVKSRFDAAIALLDDRAQALHAAVEAQKANQVLRDTFVEAAGKLDSWLKVQNQELLEEKEGGEEKERLQANMAHAVGLAKTRNTEGGALVEEVKAANTAMIAANINADEQSDLNVETLSAAFEALGLAIKKKIDVIDEAIAALSAGDIPPEKLAEFKDVFDHFDKDHSGALTYLEFKGCLQSMGEEKTDDQIKALAAELDTDKSGHIQFSEFIAFMVKTVKDSDTESEIIDAFKVLTNDADTISEDQLRQVMPKEDVEYLMQRMPGSGAKDFKAWTHEAFHGK